MREMIEAFVKEYNLTHKTIISLCFHGSRDNTPKPHFLHIRWGEGILYPFQEKGMYETYIPFLLSTNRDGGTLMVGQLLVEVPLINNDFCGAA